MVKAVVGDESQLKLAENRLTQSAPAAEVGLVIGKLSGKLDKGFVYDLVPTPPNDAGEPPCSLVEVDGGKSSKKKGMGSASSSAAAISIDKDWVAEHARQVSRMLLGGVKVVGIYIWVNESSFKNSTITLCQTVKGVADASSLMDTELNERLLVHISYSPLRWTCRNCLLSANITSNSIRPCDFKMGKVLTSLQAFRCTYNFDVRLPICLEDGSKPRKLADVLGQGILIHAKELRGAKALINGKLVIEENQTTSDDFHEVEILLPFMEDKYVEVCSQKEVIGILTFSGSICSLAYLNPKEPVSQALADIKEDIIVSMRSRLEIMCDEVEQESESISDGVREASSQTSTSKPVPQFDLQVQREFCSLSFPRRVFVPWLEGTYICDYVQPSETIEVIKDHCVELMAMEAPTDTSEILEPESEAPSLVTSASSSFWEIATSHSSASKEDKSLAKDGKTNASQRSTKSADLNLVMAILALILSFILALLLLHPEAS